MKIRKGLNDLVHESSDNHYKSRQFKYILTSNGFKHKGLGTNVETYIFGEAQRKKYPFLKYYCIKFGLDTAGYRDNFNDSLYHETLQKYNNVQYTSDNCAFSIQDRAKAFKNEMAIRPYLEEIFELIDDLSETHILVDMSPYNHKNFGLHYVTGELVLIDGSDLIPLSNKRAAKYFSKCRNKIASKNKAKLEECGGKYYYTDDYKFIKCSNCKATMDPSAIIDKIEREARSEMNNLSVKPSGKLIAMIEESLMRRELGKTSKHVEIDEKDTEVIIEHPEDDDDDDDFVSSPIMRQSRSEEIKLPEATGEYEEDVSEIDMTDDDEQGDTFEIPERSEVDDEDEDEDIFNSGFGNDSEDEDADDDDEDPEDDDDSPVLSDLFAGHQEEDDSDENDDDEDPDEDEYDDDFDGDDDDEDPEEDYDDDDPSDEAERHETFKALDRKNLGRDEEVKADDEDSLIVAKFVEAFKSLPFNLKDDIKEALGFSLDSSKTSHEYVEESTGINIAVSPNRVVFGLILDDSSLNPIEDSEIVLEFANSVTDEFIEIGLTDIMQSLSLRDAFKE